MLALIRQHAFSSKENFEISSGKGVIKPLVFPINNRYGETSRKKFLLDRSTRLTTIVQGSNYYLSLFSRREETNRAFLSIDGQVDAESF